MLELTGDIKTAYEDEDVETLACMAQRNAGLVDDLRARLAAIERQVRELITKWREGVPVWDGPRDQNGEIIEEDAGWHNYPALADECADDLEAILDPPEGE